MKHVKRFADKHKDNQNAQMVMRESFAIWAGYRRAEGLNDREIYRKFYIDYGTDYMNAMLLEPDPALNIATRLMENC